MLRVVRVEGGGRRENAGDEVVLVGLAGDGDACAVEDVLEVDDLEGFAGVG